MEESLLDFAAFHTSELMETLTTTPEEAQNNLIIEHIQKMTADSIKSVLDPEEKGEWVSGLKDGTLESYCRGRISLLDFFTYCCINCQHVLPDLRDLERLYGAEDGFVVAGIHSAKFEAERLPSNVLHAVHRLNVNHPVLNDPEAKLWTRLGVFCWPTLLLLSPDGKPIAVFAGEGHRNLLFRMVSITIDYFTDVLNCKPLKIINFSVQDNLNSGLLQFPGKVAINPFCKFSDGNPWLTISDSGNNRIIIVDYKNTVVNIIGGRDADLKDGTFNEAKFNNPQGVCWIDDNTFIVCDTGNHVVRRVTFKPEQVDILAGTGVQGEFGDLGGSKYCQQALASPWDVVMYKTADMDMSIRKPSENETPESDLRRVLLVACAGSHQIWAIFLDTTVWWKYKTYSEGTVIPVVGSGREENRNNRYPGSASLAQPSGLALNKYAMYIADSESSSIRHVDLKTGQVSPVVGADRNPMNLFAFGDTDGKGYNVRLQHPLGIYYCRNTSQVIIADTYNHKIKFIDYNTTSCSTFYPNSTSTLTLSEPGGICTSSVIDYFIVADTNNHRIVKINKTTAECEVMEFTLPKDEPVKTEIKTYSGKNLIQSSDVLIIRNDKDAKFSLNLTCNVEESDKGLHLTPSAPQRWCVRLFGSNSEDVISEWNINNGIREGKTLPDKFSAVNKSISIDAERMLRIEYFLSLCEGSVCFIKKFAVDFKLRTSNDAKENQEYNVDVRITPEHEIEITSTDV